MKEENGIKAKRDNKTLLYVAIFCTVAFITCMIALLIWAEPADAEEYGIRATWRQPRTGDRPDRYLALLSQYIPGCAREFSCDDEVEIPASGKRTQDAFFGDVPRTYQTTVAILARKGDETSEFSNARNALIGADRPAILPLSECAYARKDINGDGTVDTLDALEVLNTAIGLD